MKNLIGNYGDYMALVLPFLFYGLMFSLLLFMSGCATYKTVAPDEFSYTVEHDKMTGSTMDYITVTWNLK